MRMTALAARRALPLWSPMRLATALPRMIALRKERRALLRLDDHLLNDIGLTRDQARIEAARTVWDAPGFWRL